MEGDQAAAGSATDRLTRLTPRERRRIVEATRLIRLTPREREVLLLVGACMEYREVAGTLGVTASAVRHKVHIVREKLELGLGRPKELMIAYYERNRNLLESL